MGVVSSCSFKSVSFKTGRVSPNEPSRLEPTCFLHRDLLTQKQWYLPSCGEAMPLLDVGTGQALTFFSSEKSKQKRRRCKISTGLSSHAMEELA